MQGGKTWKIYLLDNADPGAEPPDKKDVRGSRIQSGKTGKSKDCLLYTSEQGAAEFAAGKPAAQEQIRQGEEGLAVFRQQLDQGWSGYNQLLENIKGMEDNPMDPSEPGYDEWLQTLGGLKEQADATNQQLSAQEEEYAKQSAKLEGAKKQLSDGEQKLQDTKAALDLSLIHI